MIFGESGGIERFQLAERVLCASIAERERKLLKQVLISLRSNDLLRRTLLLLI